MLWLPIHHMLRVLRGQLQTSSLEPELALREGGGAAYRGGAPALRAPHVEDCASGRLHGSQKWKFDLIVVKTGRQRRREPLGVWRQKGVSPRPAAVHCACAVASCVRKGCIICADACDTQVPACGCRHAGRCSPPTHRRSNFRNSSCP